jgi:hypothetical protein
MVAYATEGLIEKLLPLTTDQRAAIDRIVDHVYIHNQPIAHLLTGDDKICTESNYYRNGTMDPNTGKWKRKPGWGKDPAFVEALQEAARLALTARTREELTAWAEAKRRARLATPSIVGSAIDIVTGTTVARAQLTGEILYDPETGEPAIVPRSMDKDRVAAAKILLDYARLDVMAAAGEAEQSEELEWWRATDDDNDAA